MVPLTALWLPIVLASVAVFIVSSIMHMVIKHHGHDYAKVPDEEKAMEALREAGVGQGNYAMPHCADMKEMGSPEMVAKYNAGPVAFLHVIPNGPPAIGKNLAVWFGFSLLVSVLVAYLTGRVIGPGHEYLAVFRVAGTAAFLAYGVAEINDSIWKGRLWGSTLRYMLDGLVYALVTAGVFGWLWPAA